MVMLQLESQSNITQTKPEAGISSPRGSDCSSRFSGFSGDCQMKKIPLTQGKFAIVNDEDYEWLNQWKWCAWHSKNLWYACREDKGKTVFMHRVILNLSPGSDLQADHINHDGLNNTRKNLRPCTHQQNTWNMLPKGITSKYKGLCFEKDRQKWRAGLNINGRFKNFGRFDSEIEAAKIYDIGAKKHFGEFARLNFPKVRQQ